MGGGERRWEDSGDFFSIRKSYFLQVKNLVLVGTLEKICVLDSYNSNPTCGMI
ncbi:hypothetical protein LBBP_02350 [Leptospira borgpetersenii serovar Ballum]|uniref:Uncharacterized protein n=1 Tax=Leptospira borgpetersenii serovar Ballum TaxID=280505 RepID=A0A0S2ISF9_LEPBO|nr:hypothetical protein LBBP_02350 [Leptospira borgpetersenii serovar Ballum]